MNPINRKNTKECEKIANSWCKRAPFENIGSNKRL